MMSIEEIREAIALLASPVEQCFGSTESHESLINRMHSRLPTKPYCLVADWSIYRLELTAEEFITIHGAGELPLIMFVQKVIFDSQCRFEDGDWIRVRKCVSFDGVMFETKNIAYVLVGAGRQKTARLKQILSFL
jgi:hypothetical protein